MVNKLHEDVKKSANPDKAKLLARFFKTAKGEYGEGDVFVGLMVPQSRKIAMKYKDMVLDDISQVLHSKIHEERLIALFILVSQFKKGDEKVRKELVDFYLQHTSYINNWDLVDLSADKIIGEYFYQKRIDQSLNGKNILTKFARSKNIWERRIAVLSTFAFIKYGESDLPLTIADMLLHDPHDLIQKAVGWMLREVGKRVSQETEEEFLRTCYKTMPRTMLRYAIERFPEELRSNYLKGVI